MGSPPPPTVGNFEVGELWKEIFIQQKPSFEGYGGIDYPGVKAVLEVHGVELTEDLYRRISYVEDLYRDLAYKEMKKNGT